jgi:alkaline phosphatase D
MELLCGLLRVNQLSAKRMLFPMMRILTLLLLLANCQILLAQHDPNRNAVRAFAKGDTQAALAMVGKSGKKSNSPATNEERSFVRALIASSAGDAEKAMAHAREALKQGLPFERFEAGPRKPLAALYKHPEYQKLRQEHARALIQGPMLGSLTDQSARFWIRTRQPARATVAIFTAQGSPPGLKIAGTQAPAQTSAQTDFTAILEVSNLKPRTKYEYQILLDGKPQGKRASFTTYPTQGKPAKFSIGFGGGAGYNPQYEHMWKTIASRNLDALLLLGDNVYIDSPEHPLVHRYCYARRHARPEWKQLAAQTPLYAIYDDHDFGDNDCVPGPHVDQPAWKRDVWKVFTQHWNNPSYGGGEKQVSVSSIL